jgi:hypothetical protein
MPDQRPVHRHAASLYGPQGPMNEIPEQRRMWSLLMQGE